MKGLHYFQNENLSQIGNLKLPREAKNSQN